MGILENEKKKEKSTIPYYSIYVQFSLVATKWGFTVDLFKSRSDKRHILLLVDGVTLF